MNIGSSNLDANNRYSPVLVLNARTIESLNIDYTSNFFKKLDDEMPISLRNKISICVNWRSSDSRELYDIPEVRTYFMRVFDEVDSIFFWIDPFCDFFVVLGCLLYPPKTRYRILGSDTVHIDSSGFASYILMGFEKLNRFCATKDVSDMPSSTAIGQRISELFSDQSQ